MSSGIARGRLALCAHVAKALGVTALAGLAAGCAQPQVHASKHHTHEYFSQAQYGAASQRVVEDGEPVPRGGGQYLVGHPYTIAGHTYYPHEIDSYSAVGMASWYGDAFHGRRTANGEVYDMRALSAAHPTMPLPSYARVTNLANGYSVIVRVNDRGPYHGGRVMDVSSRVADVLDFKRAGTAKIKVEYAGRAPLEGSDDNQLLASLRTDGSPATIDGVPSSAPVMVASQQPAPEPERRAGLEPPRAQERFETATAPQTAAHRPPILNPPVPLARPFDLGTIPDAAFPIASAPRPLPSTPPTPPVRLSANDRALYFAPAAKVKNDPLARLLKRTDGGARLGDEP